MKILYSVKEGDQLRPLEINVPEGNIFAIYLPDGTIWDTIIGIDNVTSLTKKEFNELYTSLLPEKETN